MRRLIAPLFAFAPFACAHGAAAPPAIVPMGSAARSPTGTPAWRRPCSEPGEPKAKIEYRDAPGGAAVIYTTAGDPARLRERATEVARYHNNPRPLTAMHDLADVPHTAAVEYIERGVVLTLYASARGHVEELRIQVQQDVWAKQRRGCAAGQEAL